MKKRKPRIDPIRDTIIGKVFDAMRPDQWKTIQVVEVAVTPRTVVVGVVVGSNRQPRYYTISVTRNR